MRRPQSDVDAVLASVLATAGAFASFALLQALTTGLDDTLIGRLAPRDTVARLWVFFVLAPALVVLAGVGFPCLLRTLLALARATLPAESMVSLAAVAVGAGLVLAEAAMRGSGTKSLVLACVLCGWRLFPRASALRDRLYGPLLVTASAALLGFAVYQQRLLAGAPASIAVAPTLFLLAYYATLLGVVLGIAGALAQRAARRVTAAVSLLWLTTYAAWVVGAARWGVASTYGAGVALGLLAAWIAATSARRVDESRAVL